MKLSKCEMGSLRERGLLPPGQRSLANGLWSRGIKRKADGWIPWINPFEGWEFLISSVINEVSINTELLMKLPSSLKGVFCSYKKKKNLDTVSATLHVTSGASLVINNPLQMNLIACLLFLGLQPYTSYSFTLTACTSAGCTSSEPFLGQTLQAAPQGN